MEIYYFTGTGNSLAVAKMIAERTGAKLIPIAAVMDRKAIESAAEAVGIVFPVYYATNETGIPIIVKRFVAKLTDIGSKYLFAVCTSGYMSGETLENLAKLFRERGGELSVGFVANLGSPAYPAIDKIKSFFLQRELKMPPIAKLNAQMEKKFKRWNRKIEIVVETIKNRQKGRLETRGIIAKALIAPFLYGLIKPAFIKQYQKLTGESLSDFESLIPLADRSFRTIDKCTGCGTCSKVCPVSNIAIESGKPQWQHRCETCYACFNWCPNGAIEGDAVEFNIRYRHPGVKLSEMFCRS